MIRAPLGLLGLSVVGAMLSACQPAHATWGSQCASSHVESSVTTMPVSDGRGGITIMLVPTSQSVCDAYERICRPGRDGSTDCGVDSGR